MSYLITASVPADLSHREPQCIICSQSKDVIFDLSSTDTSWCGEVGHCPFIFHLGPVWVYWFTTPSRSGLHWCVLLLICIYLNLNLIWCEGCKIETKAGTTPPYRPIYSLSEVEQLALHELLNENLTNHFIWPSQSFADVLISLFVGKIACSVLQLTTRDSRV